MRSSASWRRLARHRSTLAIALLLGTAISSGSLAAEVDISDGDSHRSTRDVVDILGLSHVGVIENGAGFTVGSTPSTAVGVTGDLGSFINAGTILGGDGGVVVGGTVANFTNAAGGSIAAGTDRAVDLQGAVGAFINAGRISGQGDGVNIGGDVGTFTNTATGGIESAAWSAIYLNGAARDFVNAGSIIGQGLGVNVSGAVTRFVNAESGRIEGRTGTGINLGGDVGAFSNAGNINAEIDALYIVGASGAFANAASGHIESRAGTAVSFEGGVGTFANAGRIDGTGAFGVASFSDVASFANTGRIAGQAAGVYVDRALGNFANAASGEIVGVFNAVHLIGNTASFANDGVLRSTDGPPTVLIEGSVGVFRNRGTIGGGGWGVALGAVDDFFNSGTISAVGPGPRIGVFIVPSVGGGSARSFVNTGTIEATETAVRFEAGVTHMVNSGILRGGFTAFDSSGIYDDRLTLLTGSQIYGALSFGGGFDTLDFAGFIGNTVLDVGGLEQLVPGNVAYVDARRGAAGGKIAIFDISGLDNKAIGRDLGDVTGAVRHLVAGQMVGGATGASAPVLPLGYGATGSTSAATAALASFDTAPSADTGFWAGAVGGGSLGEAPLDLATRFGGLVAGSHARLGSGLVLGGLGGYFNSTASILAGGEQLSTQTALVGLYGKTALGVIDLDFTLLGGLGTHTSQRQVVAGGVMETAEGAFASFFVAPGLGIGIPVLSADTTTLSLRGETAYVAGRTSGYAETGSTMNLAVGEQVIGFFDLRLGLEARHAIDHDGRKSQVVARAGALAQANLGSSSIPVATFGQTGAAGSPGSHSLGLYGGLGVDMAMTDTFGIDLRLDGQLGLDGPSSLSASFGLGGTF